jgi:hypothetical protein
MEQILGVETIAARRKTDKYNFTTTRNNLLNRPLDSYEFIWVQSPIGECPSRIEVEET